MLEKAELSDMDRKQPRKKTNKKKVTKKDMVASSVSQCGWCEEIKSSWVELRKIEKEIDSYSNLPQQLSI